MLSNRFHSFEYFDHPAGLGFRIWGVDKNELCKNLIEAYYKRLLGLPVEGSIENVEPRISEEIQVFDRFIDGLIDGLNDGLKKSLRTHLVLMR